MMIKEILSRIIKLIDDTKKKEKNNVKS